MNLRKKFTGFALGLALMLGAGGVFAANGILKEAVGVKADDSSKSLIIDGGQLSTVETTADTTKTYGDFQIVFSKGAKQQSASGDNRFGGTSTAALIGRSGAYIYNKDPIGSKITKFEIYANKGASLKVSIGVCFSDTAITKYTTTGDNTYTTTLSTADSVYDASSKLTSNAQYFWYQVTNSYNSQVQFRITYEEAPISSLSSISLSDQTTEYYTGDEFSFDGKCTAAFEDGSSRSVVPTSVTEPDMATVGTKTVTVSYTDPNDSTNTKTAAYTINVSQYPYEGRGTEIDPYTVSDAYSIANELAKGANNGKVVYVKGVVTTESVKVSNSKATFDITDGNKTINAYSISGVSDDSSKDSYVTYDYRVVVSGALINYDGTLEVGYVKGLTSSLSSSKAPATLTINVSSVIDFEATGTFTATTDGANPSVVWSSSNEDLLYVDANGDYLAGNTAGKVTITASLTYDDCIIPVEASKEIEIADPNVHTVSIEGDSTVKVGKTIQLTAECSKGDGITWTSSNGNASVSDAGLVTGLAEGNAVITATCANGDKGTKEILIEPKDILFKKVTSPEDLVVGKEVMIADYQATKVMSTTQNNNNRGAVNATLDGDYIVKTSTTAVFTLLPAKNGGYAFYDETLEKMLASNSSSSNVLKTDGEYGVEKAEKAYVTISFNSESGGSFSTSVVFQGSNTRNVLQYNSDSSLFSCYASASQTNVSVYTAVEGDPVALGDSWAKQFNTTANCDLTGVKTLSSDTWATLTDEFKTQSIPEKMAASYLDINSSIATTDFINAINSYEHCLTKYGYTSFIDDRGVSTGSASNKIHLIKDSDSTILTTVLVYFTSVAAIGTCFFLKKKKHN